jgi:hypothetical protein
MIKIKNTGCCEKVAAQLASFLQIDLLVLQKRPISAICEVPAYLVLAAARLANSRLTVSKPRFCIPEHHCTKQDLKARAIHVIT